MRECLGEYKGKGGGTVNTKWGIKRKENKQSIYGYILMASA